ncbi:MAG TPA: hypothetical protein VMP08_04755 [Anaerolineae bacterium]|nr:hypothetical protein [Anaerolineae bacterium]
MKTLLSPKFVIPSLIILAVLIFGVTLLAPTDKTLGEATRMVYVHGAIIRVVLGAFLLSGVLGLIYLFSKRSALAQWSQILLETALLLWIPYLISATIATLQTWGAIAWFEPRWLVTLQISVIAPVAYVVALVVKKPIVTAALNALVAAAIFVLTRSAGLVLHPIDPISSSGDSGIIGSYLILLVLCALFAAQVARGLRYWHQRGDVIQHAAG